MIRTHIPIQIMSHNKNFDLNKVEYDLETNCINNKPKKALWTSDWVDEIFKSGWLEWNIQNYSYNISKCYLKDSIYKITPKDKEFKVYEIDSPEDIEKIPKEQSMDKEASLISKILFDYNKLKEEGYDGLHVTERGVTIGKAWTPFGFDTTTFLTMNMFDCESTVWFNTDWIDKIEVVKEDAKQAALDYLDFYE